MTTEAPDFLRRGFNAGSTQDDNDLTPYARRLTAAEFRSFETAVKQHQAYMAARGQDPAPGYLDQIYAAVLDQSAARSEKQFEEHYRTYVLGYLAAQVRLAQTNPTAYADWSMALASAQSFLPGYLESYHDIYLRRRAEWTGGDVPYMGMEEFNARAPLIFLQESQGRLATQLAEDQVGGASRIAETAAILGEGIQALGLAQQGAILQAEQRDIRKQQLESTLDDMLDSLREQVFETEAQRKRADSIIATLSGARGRLAADYAASDGTLSSAQFLDQAIGPVLQRRFVGDPQAASTFAPAQGGGGGLASLGNYIAAAGTVTQTPAQRRTIAANRLFNEDETVRARFTPEVLEQINQEAVDAGVSFTTALERRVRQEATTEAERQRRAQEQGDILAGRVGPGGQVPLEEFLLRARTALKDADPEVRAQFEGTVSETDFQDKLSAIYNEAVRLKIPADQLFRQRFGVAAAKRQSELSAQREITEGFRAGGDIGGRTVARLNDVQREVFIRDWLPVAYRRASQNGTDINQEVESLRRAYNATINEPAAAQRIMAMEGITPINPPPALLPKTQSPQTVEQAVSEGNQALADELLKKAAAEEEARKKQALQPVAPAPAT